MYIRKFKIGNKHEKCILKSRKNCSSNISREHYISNNLLNVIEKNNKTIDVAGLLFLPKNKIKSIGKSSLVSKILCATHNSNLSTLDTLIGDFVSFIIEIDIKLQSSISDNKTYEINGRSIEQWLLKTIIGLIESGNIKQKNGENYQYESRCIDYLCEPKKRWPKYWGLYISLPESSIHHSKSFEIIPKSNNDTGEILAVAVKFNGFEMHLCMGQLDESSSFGLYRPTELIFSKGNICSKIKITWPMKVKKNSINFTQIGTYTGLAPTHDIKRAE